MRINIPSGDMSAPVDFCKKRMTNLKEIMAEKELDLFCLVKDQKRRQQYHPMMRLTNTSFGTALLVPIDDDPVLLCTPDEKMDSEHDTYIDIIDTEYRPMQEEVVKYANEYTKEGSKVGMNSGVLLHKPYVHIENNLKGEIQDISKTVLPELLYGIWDEELKFQREASRLADIAIKAIHECLRPGIKECEVAAEATYAMMKAGAESLKFHTVVSSGVRSAYIHCWPGQRVIKDGDLVLIDLGPIKDGYTADISRTFLVGKDAKKEKMIRTINESVEAVLDMIKPGVSCRDLDRISREVIIEKGYPDYPTGLGHCLSGFPVPKLSKTTTDIERVGSLHTVEPGIYIRGFGGGRIEEDVVVTEDGVEVLTKSPRHFLDL